MWRMLVDEHRDLCSDAEVRAARAADWGLRCAARREIYRAGSVAVVAGRIGPKCDFTSGSGLDLEMADKLVPTHFAIGVVAAP